MFNIGNLVQKAQQFIEPTLSNIAAPASSDRRPSKATLFRYQFRLPDSQNPLQEITAELTPTNSYKKYDSAPIKLQAHGDPSPPISFRNIWLRPL